MKILFFAFILTSLTCFSQEISKDDPVHQLYLPTAEENTISNLAKYKGQHIAKSVDEYKYVDGVWKFIQSDTTSSEISYFDYYLTFKRSYLKEFLVRYLLFENYNKRENYYSYSSYYGSVWIYNDFKTIILFDKPDTNGNPTNKYIFNF